MSHVLQIFSVLIDFLFKADFLKQMFTFYIVNYFFPLWLLAFPGGPEVKASAWNAGDVGSIPGSGRSPGEGNGNPLQYPWPGESHGGRSLVGYSPRVRKESDTTERLHFHFCLN